MEVDTMKTKYRNDVPVNTTKTGLIDNVSLLRLSHNIPNKDNDLTISVASIVRMLSGYNSCLNLYLKNKTNDLFRAVSSYSFSYINFLQHYNQVLTDNLGILNIDATEVFKSQFNIVPSHLYYSLIQDDPMIIKVGSKVINDPIVISSYTESPLMTALRLAIYYNEHIEEVKTLNKSPLNINFQDLFTEWMVASDSYNENSIHEFSYSESDYKFVFESIKK